VARFGKKDLAGFVAEHYGPDRIIVAAAGAVDPEAIARDVERLFGGLAPRRYACLACHVSQTEARPLVENRFQDMDALTARRKNIPSSCRQNVFLPANLSLRPGKERQPDRLSVNHWPQRIRVRVWEWAGRRVFVVRVGPRLVPRCQGLYVLTALGSRGITWAPLAAQTLAAWITGAPLPLEASLLDAVDVARFASRAARHGGRSVQPPPSAL